MIQVIWIRMKCILTWDFVSHYDYKNGNEQQKQNKIFSFIIPDQRYATILIRRPQVTSTIAISRGTLNEDFSPDPHYAVCMGFQIKVLR